MTKTYQERSEEFFDRMNQKQIAKTINLFNSVTVRLIEAEFTKEQSVALATVMYEMCDTMIRLRKEEN